ncbi:hypothetical protein D3C71_1995500 [compost metagenome]
MRSPTAMKGGTMTLRPLERMAGLNWLDTLWPFCTGSTSVTSSTTLGGKRMPSGVSSCISRVIFMPSCRKAARSPTKSLASSTCS